ncbi:hypothetical protein [Vagococcus sp. WN89Y]|uniref:hypothetical protein n=1 Tax=Vagococcus sp. WN89Y TaxID=3457258 RepID=UPI003FCC32F0
MDVSGNIYAANRSHITWTNAERADKAQNTSVQTSPLMSNISSVSSQQTTASQFHKAPGQTHLAQQHVRSMAHEGLPKALQEAKLSRQAEPLKTLLGIIGKDILPQDKATFNKVCQKLVDAKGNPKKESKVADNLSLLLMKYGEVSLNKFITSFTEDCREAWRQNHTGFGDTVADEMIFNSSMLACQEVLEKQIQFLTGPNVSWVNMGQYADFFEHTCTAVSKTLIHYDTEADKAKPAAGPDNPASPVMDTPDAPVPPQSPDSGTQFSLPGGPGHGPINITIAGPTATATANGASAETAGAAKPATNAFDFGIELLKNPPKNEFEAGLIRDYMNRVLPQVQSVSNSDSDTLKTSTTTQGTQTDFMGAMDFASTQTERAGKGVDIATDPFVDGDSAGASELNADQSVQISTGLLDELLTPPQTSGNDHVETQLGNNELIDLQADDTESLYDVSRQVADALSDLVSEMGSPPASPSLSESGAFFSDQIQQQQSAVGQVAMQTLDGSAIEIEGASQDTIGTGFSSTQFATSQAFTTAETATLTGTSRLQFAADAPAIRPQGANIQATNADEVQEQPLQGAGANSADLSSAMGGNSRLMQSVADRERGVNGQEMSAVQGKIMDGAEANTATITSPVRGNGRVMPSPAGLGDRVNAQEITAVQRQAMQGADANTVTITSPVRGNGRVMQSSPAQEKQANELEQPAVQEHFMSGPDANNATVTSPTRGKGRVTQTIADWEKRANDQLQQNEQSAGQPGSGMNGAKVRNNAMGTNINYGKDFFQPLKGMKETNSNYTSHPVYTTNRTIDPFSRVSAPNNNFVKQFNPFEVNTKDHRRLSTGSISSGFEE